MRSGPWQLKSDSFNVIETLWQNLWVRGVENKSALSYLRKAERIYSQDISQKRAIQSKALVHFITNCELAYRELNEMKPEHFVSNNDLAKLTAYDGFVAYTDVDVSPLAQFHSALISQQIQNMYAFLANKQISDPAAYYVNAALCQFLLNSAEYSGQKQTKKATTQKEDIKIHVPFWCNHHKLASILNSDLVKQLIQVFRTHNNFYALHKATEIWKEQVGGKLKRFYQKNSV